MLAGFAIMNAHLCRVMLQGAAAAGRLLRCSAPANGREGAPVGGPGSDSDPRTAVRSLIAADHASRPAP